MNNIEEEIYLFYSVFKEKKVYFNKTIRYFFINKFVATFLFVQKVQKIIAFKVRVEKWQTRHLRTAFMQKNKMLIFYMRLLFIQKKIKFITNLFSNVF